MPLYEFRKNALNRVPLPGQVQRVLQACLLPAGFGDYEFLSPVGSQGTVVMIRLKRA